MFKVRDIAFVSAIRMPGYDTTSGIYASNKQQAKSLEVWYDETKQLVYLKGLKTQTPVLYVISMAQVKYFTLDPSDESRLMDPNWNIDPSFVPQGLESVSALQRVEIEKFAAEQKDLEVALEAASRDERTASDAKPVTVSSLSDDPRPGVMPLLNSDGEELKLEKPKTPISVRGMKREKIRTGSKRK